MKVFFNRPMYVTDPPCVASSLVEYLTRKSRVSHKYMAQSGEGVVNKTTLWNLRLGHIPMDKLTYISGVEKTVFDEVCLTWPISKMLKLLAP